MDGRIDPSLHGRRLSPDRIRRRLLTLIDFVVGTSAAYLPVISDYTAPADAAAAALHQSVSSPPRPHARGRQL